MADKEGDIFTDKKGISYVLGHDPDGGHLRPYTIKDEGEDGDGGLLEIIVWEGIKLLGCGIVLGSIWVWNKFTEDKKPYTLKDDEVNID